MDKQEPGELVAGDSWRWHRPDLLALYPGQALTYRLHPLAGGASVELVADAGFAVAVLPAESATYAPGAWGWAAIVSDGTDRATVGHGRFTVLPDPASAQAADGRSWAERMLEAVEATLAGRATADHEAFTIEGRSVTRIPFGELMKHRARLRAAVAREQGAASFTTARVQFT